ncbi:MAG: hypothetical protein KF687_13780 [Cyclobacteriaceae bacterium]|nr:hypothetical protein [Cyclobacteriaceae bacterium]
MIRKFLVAYGYDFSAIKSGLSIRRIPNTDFIQVDFVSDHPELSALAANAFCEEFIRLSRSQKSERAGESVEFLSQLVADKKKDLDEKLETQRIFKTSNTLFNVQREGENKLGQLTELEKVRDDLRSNLQRIELTKDRLIKQLSGVGSTSQVSDNQKIIELRNTINSLNERYITGGQTNSVLRDSISLLREQLRIQTEYGVSSSATPTLSRAEIQNRLNELEVEHQVTRSDLNTVDAKIRSLQYSFSGYASKEAKLAAIQQEVDLASQEYLDAVAKFNEAKNKLLSGNTLRQVSMAFPPVNPLNSKRLLIVGFAAFSSFSLCIFLIVLFEFLDQSIRSIDKFNALVNLPLLGTITKLPIKNLNIPQLFSQTGNEDVELFKSLIRKLRHEVVSLNSPVLLITSLRKNEGKTFIILTLCYVLSLINKRVLIVDTNFRNNMLSNILPKSQVKGKAIENKKPSGLLAANNAEPRLDDDSDDKEMAYELINPTIFKNVFIVTNSGGGGASPAEILSGRNFKNLIEGFRENFDYILMEGGALNEYADTKELVQYVDKVLTIFSAQSSIGQQDRESISYVKTLGEKFGGCILNRIESKDLRL